MFSGIVETIGKVTNLKDDGSNKHITIQSQIANEAYVDQSIAHNGVCLTIVKIEGESYTVTAIKESIDKTNIGHWKIGDMINLERAVMANSRMDGHFVQGHVDTIAICQAIIEQDGSWYFEFKAEDIFGKYLVPKGSVCINGVSLTVVKAEKGAFSVAIIPYTFNHTNFNTIQPGDVVNIEFDILGKYILKYLENINIS